MEGGAERREMDRRLRVERNFEEEEDGGEEGE